MWRTLTKEMPGLPRNFEQSMTPSFCCWYFIGCSGNPVLVFFFLLPLRFAGISGRTWHLFLADISLGAPEIQSLFYFLLYPTSLCRNSGQNMTPFSCWYFIGCSGNPKLDIYFWLYLTLLHWNFGQKHDTFLCEFVPWHLFVADISLGDQYLEISISVVHLFPNEVARWCICSQMK